MIAFDRFFNRLPGLLIVFSLVPGYLTAQSTLLAGDPLIARGDSLLLQGDTRSAEQVFQQVLQKEASAIPAYLGLARVALAEENYRAANRWLDEVFARDPENLDANYYHGISSREVAKYRGLLNMHEWSNATDYFEKVIARDSLFRDVLYQYALLLRYGGHYKEAALLGEAQIRLRPELTEPRRELFRLYKQLLNHMKKDEVLEWLDAHPSEYAQFARGEFLRKQGEYAAADAIFVGLLRSPVIPIQPVLLSRARIYYELNQPEKAQSFVYEAIRSIQDRSDALLVFEDFKYIFSESELDQFGSLHAPDSLRAFFEAFWVRRNPLPSAAVMERMTEHYRRLLKAEKDYVFDGVRSWLNDPDKLGELVLPKVYDLNEDFNDKGIIYIRHGEPDDRVVTVSGMVDPFRTGTGNAERTDWLPKDQSFDAGWVPNESWRYYSPDMDFHFVVDEGGSVNNWRLTPALMNYEMLEDRSHWGGVYARLASLGRSVKERRERIEMRASNQSNQTLVELPRPDEDSNPDPRDDDAGEIESPASEGRDPSTVTLPALDVIAYREEMVELSQEDITLALTTDQHSWSEETLPLDVPYLLTAFKDPEGQTRLEIHFALPIGILTQSSKPGANTIDVEVGCALLETDWQEVSKEVNIKHLPPVPDREAAVLDYCSFVAEADSYQVAFHSRPVETNHLGGYQFGYRVPDLSGSSLLMSDILPASDIKPAIGPSRFTRNELYITANPFLRFPVNQPVYLYYEVYNLSSDADGKTQYTITYTLIPEERKGGFLGIGRRRDQPALALETQRSGFETSPFEFAEIDVASVDPGKYTLKVEVVDELSGASVERSTDLDIVK